MVFIAMFGVMLGALNLFTLGLLAFEYFKRK